jgi:virginiamycin A acetyltransferase
MIGNIMSKVPSLTSIMSRIKRGMQKKAYTELLRKDERYRNNRIGPHVDLGNAVLRGGCVIKAPVVLRGNITIGKYSTIGQECVLHGGTILMGNYCQLGPRVAIYALNHPMNRVSPYINRELFDGRLKNAALDEPIIIGNDVWIGYGALLLPGVHIGNGAVIGAGAVVSKDVGSYEVSVGNPARIVKSRFDQELVELLNRWQWWNLDPEELRQHESVFFEDIEANPDVLRVYLKKIMAKK